MNQLSQPDHRPLQALGVFYNRVKFYNNRIDEYDEDLVIVARILGCLGRRT